MLSDLGFVFLWWLAISAIGWVFLPLAVKIFKGFFDSGYLFAKVLGILVSSFAVWLLASTRVLPFFTESIWLVLIGGLAINLWLAKKEGFIKTNRSRVWLWLGEEGLFFLTLAAWAWVRGFQPDIQGLEKFMDFGFVNSILKSQYFPPADMWFAGKSINYYYFGHFVTAFLTKLTGIDSAITYNLTIATLFAFTFSLTFSLTGNLIFTFTKQKIKERILVGGLLAAVLISLGANLHPAWYNFKMKILNRPYCDGSLSYWYPNATRYIGYCPDVDDKTIHEFPSYSFIVSDLHGHVSDIPFVLLFLALSFSLLTTLSQKKEFDRKDLYRYWPIPLSLAAMYITNQWDFPIYLLIFGLVLVLSFYRFFGFSLKTIAKTVTYLGISLVFAVLLVLPFQLNFEPMAKGVALVNARSLPHQLLILWGVPWAFGLTFMAFLVKKNFSSLKSFIKNIKKRGFDLPGLEGSGGDIFVLILLAVATILVIIPELIFLKDIYIASYHRANTMFKLTYQSFIMYSIAAGYIFSRVISGIRKKGIKMTVSFVFLLGIFSLCLYPNYSIPGYYGKLKSENYKGLYGLHFLQRLYPDDYRVVGWLKENVVGQPVLVEAAGDSYTNYERISMATGLPTIEGWLVHEWLWRGSFDEPGKRATEVQKIYESSNAGETKTILEKYQAKYIIVGELEREKYPNLNEAKIKKMGKKVFESGQTAIYELL